MSQQQINRGRQHDRAIKKAYYGKLDGIQSAIEPKETPLNSSLQSPKSDLWIAIKRWLTSMFG